jgi:hypothetical protein
LLISVFWICKAKKNTCIVKNCFHLSAIYYTGLLATTGIPRAIELFLLLKHSEKQHYLYKETFKWKKGKDSCVKRINCRIFAQNINTERLRCCVPVIGDSKAPVSDVLKQ